MVPKDVFLTYIRDYTEVLVSMMQHFVKTIRRFNDRVVGLSSTTVVQRVYEQILEIAEPDPVNPRRLIIETMPAHKEIAVWAGTTPETVALIQWGLSRLADRHARLLEAFHFDGQSTRSIAEARGLSERAIEGRLHRARAALRKRLAPMLPGAGDAS